MNGRVLVWPWHGRLQGGQIQLADSSYRSHPQPPNNLANLDLCGPCDTHLIEVEGIDPITPEEAAIAPPGSEFWAGRALLSAGWLYGERLDGWIAQIGNARWWIKIADVAVGASSTTGKFQARRFGLIGGGAAGIEFPFTLGHGVATLADVTANLLSGSSSATGSGFLRLHAVSPSGRTAILALVARIPLAGWDRRPRAYRFYRVDVVDAGEVVGVAVTQLYDLSDIRSGTAVAPASVALRVIPAARGAELSRTPVYNSEDELWAYDVTYNWDTPSGLEPTFGTATIIVPGDYSAQDRLMVRVRFDGETPVPVYMGMEYEYTVPWPELEWTTDRVEIRREYLAGGIDVLQEPQVTLSGGYAIEYEATYFVGDWADSVQISASGTISGSGMACTHTVSGAAGAITHSATAAVANIGAVYRAALTSDGSTRRPLIISSAPFGFPGAPTYLVGVDLLSNNLMAVSGQIGSGATSYLSALAEGAPLALAGTWQGVSAYGSYNPVTAEFAISSTPVNWI